MIFEERQINKLKQHIEELKKQGKTIVWTNGCFDIIHPGHIETFKKAKQLGDILVVGLNGDTSPYWKTKPGRPINDENFRSKMLDAIKYVDFVYIFNDETPVKPVEILKPDIVLKGGDYYITRITEDDIRRLSEDNIQRLQKINSEDYQKRSSEILLNKSSDKSLLIKEFNEIVETKLVKKSDGIIDVTGIYKFFIENNLIDVVKDIKGYMPEGEVCVRYGGKVVLVPVVKGYSTTNIVEKILDIYCK